jgi:hypothetical protein
MADSLKAGIPGYGDSQPLTVGLPNVVVSDDRVGVREIDGGRLQHRMLRGTLSNEEENAIQQNLNKEQKKFQR